MKKILLAILLLSVMLPACGQSKTTLALEEKYDASMTLFFYKNTLRMLNQTENAEFDELIQNIEKMKFLLVDKNKGKFGKAEYRTLVDEYKKESFEMIVTSRIDGRNFDVYLRDDKRVKPGTVVLVNDSTSLYVLDIVGTIDVSKAGSLFDTIGGSSDIGSKIRRFTDPESDTVKRRNRRHRIR